MAGKRSSWLVAGTVVLATACGGSPTHDSGPGSSTAPGDPARLTIARAVHRATTLPDGRVLLTGGCTKAGCGGIDEGRLSVLLSASGRSSEGARMRRPRAAHTATLLPGGRVLVVGGFGADGEALASTEIYDPVTQRFAPGPRLSSPRADHVSVRDGERVVLVGGTTDGPALDTTDVLAAGSWSPGTRLAVGRVKHAVVVLPRHRLLVVGGATDVQGRSRLDSTELLPAAGPSSPGPRHSGPEYKLDGAVVTLRDGRVVVAGGRRVDVYDPRLNTMRVLATPVLPRLSFRTASVVGPRMVLLAGGYDDAFVPTDELVMVTVPARLP